MTPEGKVKKMVREAMAEKWPDAYRFMPVQNGMGSPSLDFLYCVRGKFIGIETKTVKTKKPTPRQENTINEIINAGGYAGVVYDELTLEVMINEIEYRL